MNYQCKKKPRYAWGYFLFGLDPTRSASRDLPRGAKATILAGFVR